MHTTTRLLALAMTLATPAASADPPANPLPEGFTYADAIPGVQLDLRYFGQDNFVGRRVAGYEADRLILTQAATEALAGVQRDLEASGLGLLVFDGYRPQRAVDDFVAWAADPDATGTKARFYPHVPKSELFDRGYIASRSSHSRGSTVDLTIVAVEPGGPAPLDMGTAFDFFSPKSWPSSAEVSPQARANRLLLKEVMMRHGFLPLEQEWWHFTLAGEPFPDTYFDFPIR